MFQSAPLTRLHNAVWSTDGLQLTVTSFHGNSRLPTTGQLLMGFSGEGERETWLQTCLNLLCLPSTVNADNLTKHGDRLACPVGSKLRFFNFDTYCPWQHILFGDTNYYTVMVESRSKFTIPQKMEPTTNYTNGKFHCFHNVQITAINGFLDMTSLVAIFKIRFVFCEQCF